MRTPGEYAGGHIPGAVNVPLQQIGAIASEVPDKSTPLFVYCMSGARSQQAVGALKQMGYTDARNIGGIGSWRGMSSARGRRSSHGPYRRAPRRLQRSSKLGRNLARRVRLSENRRCEKGCPMRPYEELIFDIPNYPKPGVVFKDHAAFRRRRTPSPPW